MEQLGTDSCRGTVPMELPVPNCSMQHQNPVGDFDDTRMILQGASCTIAALHCQGLPKNQPALEVLVRGPLI